MKGFLKGELRIGPLTISRYDLEYVIVLRFGRKTIVRELPRRRVHHISVLFLSIVLIFSIYLLTLSSNSTVDDEEIKNRLLLSSSTDYTEPVKSKALEVRNYRVVAGDTLSAIAKKFGVSVDTICGSNSLRSYDFIRQGQKLKIPNKDGILFRVKKGTNLIKLAKKYKVAIDKILSANSFVNSDFLQIGDNIFIPDAKPQNIIKGFMWPTRGRVITAGFGWRRNPFNRRRRQFHSGMDIRANYEWIRSAKYGKITYAGWLGGYGKAVIIAHPKGWKTLYGHLSRIIVRKGQYVKQGQTIARSGSTGRSTGPHLHFEIIKRGVHKNPYAYLRGGHYKHRTRRRRR